MEDFAYSKMEHPFKWIFSKHWHWKFLYYYFKICRGPDRTSKRAVVCPSLPYTKIITTITRHQSDLDKPVSAFKGLPSRSCPFGPQFSIPFAILLLFVLVTCRGKFDLYLLTFLSTGLLSALTKFQRSFCGQQKCTGLFFWKISSALSFIIKPTRCPNFTNFILA